MNFNVNQTTTGQTLTIADPVDTVVTAGKVITVNNTGTADFTIEGQDLVAGSTGISFVWTGTEWNPLGSSSSENIVTADLTATSDRTHDFSQFSQTWNDLGDFAKVYTDSVATTTTTETSSHDRHDVTVTDTTDGSNSQITTRSDEATLSSDIGADHASIGVERGNLNVPQIHAVTAGVNAGTATVNQVLTLIDPVTGETEFASVASGGITDWAPGVAYAVDDVFTVENRLYKVNTAYTSTNMNADRGNLDELTKTHTGVSFSGLIYYYTDEIVLNDNRYVKRSVGGLSETLFNNIEAAKYTLVCQTEILPFTSSTYYYEGEQILDSGVVYQRNTAGISGISFNTTEKTNWTALSSSAQTIQTLSVTGSVTAWNSTVISAGTTDITLTLPDALLANLGQQITIKNNGTGTITVSPFAGNTITGQVSIKSGYATTYTLTQTGQVNSTSSIDPASELTITYGRVNAVGNLTSKSFVSTGIGSSVDFTGTVYSSGTTFSGTNGIIPSVSGRYKVDYYLNAGSDETAFNATVNVVQGGVAIGSVYLNQHNSAGSVNQSAGFIDIQLASSLPVFLYYKPDSTEAVAFDQGSYFQLTQITGNLPVTGQTVDYVDAVPVAGTYDNTTILMTINSGDIPHASGVFTLTAGKKYNICAYVQCSNGGWILEVRDVANNLIKLASTLIEDGGTNYGRYVNFIYSPLVNTSIKFVQASVGGKLISATNSYVSIIQVGSTSNTVGTLPALDQSASGYFDIGNMRIQWGTHNDGNVDTTTVTLPASFANTGYSVTATSNTSAGSLCTESKTTTTFDIDRASTTVTTQVYSWVAI
jgi:hypothetical protein